MVQHSSQSERWTATVAKLRADPQMLDDLLQSALTSMAVEGFEIEPERAADIFERVLQGPPLVLLET